MGQKVNTYQGYLIVPKIDVKWTRQTCGWYDSLKCRVGDVSSASRTKINGVGQWGSDTGFINYITRKFGVLFSWPISQAQLREKLEQNKHRNARETRILPILIKLVKKMAEAERTFAVGGLGPKNIWMNAKWKNSGPKRINKQVDMQHSARAEWSVTTKSITHAWHQ